MIDRNNISVFYSTPTAIKSLMSLGDEIPADYDLSSLPALVSLRLIRMFGHGTCSSLVRTI